MNFQSGYIAVVGRPNVGKSTLVNELIGQKLSITSHRPQTTRHRINAIDTQQNYQMVFVDTPGIHIGNNKAINSYMNKAASSSFADVDMIIWLVEIFKYLYLLDFILYNFCFNIYQLLFNNIIFISVNK